MAGSFKKSRRIILAFLIGLALSVASGGSIYGETSVPDASEQPDPGNDLALLDEPATTSKLGWNGFVVPFFYAATKNGAVFSTQPGGTIDLKVEGQFGKNWAVKLDVRANQFILKHDDDLETDIREACLDWNAGNMDFRVGKQVIVWGTADGINPTDNLSPKDTRLFTSDDNDRRLGVNAVQAKYYFGDYYVNGIWIPVFTPNRITFGNASAAGLIINSDECPSQQLENSEWAVKFGTTRGAIDYSFSFYSGWNRTPEMHLAGVEVSVPGSTSIYLTPRYHRIQVIGVDFSKTVGKYGLRGEAAYCASEGGSHDNPEIIQPFFWMVLGADRTFFQSFNINLQYIHRTVFDFHDPVAITNPVARQIAVSNAILQRQLAAEQDSVSLRLNNKWLQETLEAEVLGIYDFYEKDYLLAPKISYAFTDSFRAILGATIFEGDGNTFYGMKKNYNVIFLQLKYSF